MAQSGDLPQGSVGFEIFFLVSIPAGLSGSDVNNARLFVIPPGGGAPVELTPVIVTQALPRRVTVKYVTTGADIAVDGDYLVRVWLYNGLVPVGAGTRDPTNPENNEFVLRVDPSSFPPP